MSQHHNFGTHLHSKSRFLYIYVNHLSPIRMQPHIYQYVSATADHVELILLQPSLLQVAQERPNGCPWVCESEAISNEDC
jgi:hypothetical protein